MDKKIKELLSTASNKAQKILDDYNGKKLDAETQRKINTVNSFHAYLIEAEKNENKLTGVIIKELIERYLQLTKEYVLYHVDNMTGDIHTHFLMGTSYKPEELNSLIDFGTKYPNNTFLYDTQVFNINNYSLEYKGLPVVRYIFEKPKNRNDYSKVVPALFNKGFFYNLGIDFNRPEQNMEEWQLKREPNRKDVEKLNERVSVVVTYDKYENFTKKVLAEDFDLTKYLTVEEIESYRKQLNELSKDVERANIYKERCDNGLDIVLCDITEKLLAKVNSNETLTTKSEYTIQIPMYLYSHNVADSDTDSLFTEKIGQDEYNLLKWMCTNTKYRREKICYYQHKKGKIITYIPFKYGELEDKLKELGWSKTLCTTQYGLDHGTCDRLEVRVNSLKFIKQIINSSKKNNKPEKTK